MGKNTLFLTKISIKLLNFSKKEEKMGELEEIVLYAGIDESNHGHDNEIFVAVQSYEKKYSFFGKYAKSVDAGNPGETKKQRTERVVSEAPDYSFLILQQEFKRKIPPSHLIGVIISSLLQDVETEMCEKIKIYLDGEWKSTDILYIKDRTADVLRIKKDEIEINYGAKFDQKIKLVNFADHLAHYLFREKTLEELEKNKRLKKIIF
jgi:hypothetical protein